MKINGSSVTIETMGTFKEAEFGIGDPSLFLEYLRKTIYSNPKRAICQELMSNARDAHREAGIADRPIHVKLPNKFITTWECRDWGPGIDPQRMVDVFVKFGASTKRGDDKNATDDGGLQTGGFGIGAKTPWAYTDSFTIRTTAWEGSQLVQRTYIAIIAEDRKSKLMELDGSMWIIDPKDTSIPVEDRHTGTTIIVDVKAGDFDDFKRYTVDVTKFWDVRPELTGCDPLPDWPEVEVRYQGTNWAIVKESRQGYYNGNHSYAIIDGIPYKLDTDAIEDKTDEMYRLVRAGVHLHVPLNSVSVALSRESIQYDPPTQAKLKDMLQAAVDELKVLLETEISKADNLWDAKIALMAARKTFEGGSIINTVPWTAQDGTQIVVSIEDIQGETTNWKDDPFIRFEIVNGYNGVRMKSKKQSRASVSPDHMLVINDEQMLSRLKIETLFEENPDIKRIYVMNPTDSTHMDRWEVKYNISYMNLTKLSDVEKKKRVRIPGTSTYKTVSNVYQFDPSSYNRKWRSVDMDLKNDTGYYIEFERSGAKDMDHDEVTLLMETLGVKTLYGIPTRFIGSMGAGWESIIEKGEAHWKAIATPAVIKKIREDDEGRSSTMDSKMSRFHSISKSLRSSLADDQCLLARWIDMSNDIESYTKTNNKVINEIRSLKRCLNKHREYNDVNIDDHEITGMHEKVLEAYPLLRSLDHWSLVTDKATAEDIALYINAKGI